MAQPRNGKRERPKNAKGTLLRIVKYCIHNRTAFVFTLFLVLVSNCMSQISSDLQAQPAEEAVQEPVQAE